VNVGSPASGGGMTPPERSTLGSGQFAVGGLSGPAISSAVTTRRRAGPKRPVKNRRSNPSNSATFGASGCRYG
jgi:hypothetical protein